VNARSGIRLLVELLLPKTVWVPSYLCNSIVQPITGSRSNIQFYEVNGSLAVPSLQWLDQVRRGDLVIFVAYFGVSCDVTCIVKAKEKGAWVLEDACQALLSTGMGTHSDFVLFSPRKFVGVPDGGILSFNPAVDVSTISLEGPPAAWWLKALLAAIMRREFDLYGGSRRWFELFREVENKVPIGNYAMSELSQILLAHAFDYSAIAQQRLENYHVLAGELSGFALFPQLPPGTVPLGFPIRLPDRDKVRQVLFDQDIFPPWHWSIEGVVPEGFQDSHRLAAEIMTLPCDQRYDSSDMQRMARLILNEAKR
jgi:dTDP-4-amino-4,6-dideoxygalactose transaminase